MTLFYQFYIISFSLHDISTVCVHNGVLHFDHWGAPKTKAKAELCFEVKHSQKNTV